ncbi:MAG: hypothetical protein JWM07_235 [Candidatus Saccharibacteria bacterium]|nr:hypothetical protein [Candidatus Saccharibacteria bacterium]
MHSTRTYWLIAICEQSKHKRFVVNNINRRYSTFMEDKLLKLVYTFFLGIIIALFVGMGISTFYTAPVMPEYPMSSHPQTEPSKTSAEELKAQRTYDEQYKTFSKDSEVYHRNVSIISIVFAVAFVMLSLVFERKNRVIANGIMMGGIFVLIYSIGRGVASTDTKYTFIAVCISLAVVLYLGYRRFGGATPLKAKTTAKKRKK